MSTIAGSRLLNMRICILSFSFMIVKKESMRGLMVGQKKGCQFCHLEIVKKMVLKASIFKDKLNCHVI